MTQTNPQKSMAPKICFGLSVAGWVLVLAVFGFAAVYSRGPYDFSCLIRMAFLAIGLSIAGAVHLVALLVGLFHLVCRKRQKQAIEKRCQTGMDMSLWYLIPCGALVLIYFLIHATSW